MIHIEKRANGSKRVYTTFPESELADQKVKGADDSFREECDVNVILKRFMKNGTPIPALTGQFLDVSEIKDLQGSINDLQMAQEAFDSLPAETRFRFQNNAVEMINFLQDDRNYEESIKLGLRIRPETGPGPTRPETSDSALAKKHKPQTNSNPQSKIKTKTLINDDDLNDDDNA